LVSQGLNGVSEAQLLTNIRLFFNTNQYDYKGGGDHFRLYGGFLTFPLRRACTRPTLDLMDCSVGAWYFSVVVVYFCIRHFPQRLWWIKLKQNVHYDIIVGDV
jgi:hypothetical protein